MKLVKIKLNASWYCARLDHTFYAGSDDVFDATEDELKWFDEIQYMFPFPLYDRLGEAREADNPPPPPSDDDKKEDQPPPPSDDDKKEDQPPPQPSDEGKPGKGKQGKGKQEDQNQPPSEENSDDPGSEL